MESEHTARPEPRPRDWIRQGVAQAGAGDQIDERSMRALEVLVAGLVLLVAALLSVVQPPGGGSLGVVEIIALGCVLFVVALVSLIR